MIHQDEEQFRGEEAACRFCSIIRKEAEACIVFEGPDCIAFLDRRPLFPGHVLLVPRKHYVTLGDLPESLVLPLFSSARLLAGCVERAMGAEGTFVALNNRVSQSVPHLHVHIVPRRKGDGLKGFFWPRHDYSGEEEISRTGSLIRSAVAGMMGEPGGRRER